MTAASGLRLLGDDDLLAALEEHLVPRLSSVVSRHAAGHCMRMDDIEVALAVRLCRRLRSATRSQIHVLGGPPDVPVDVAATSTKIVELRNPDSDGTLRPPLLVFVPPGARASAEDSFGVATFEQIVVGRVYAELASELQRALPDELGRSIEDLFRVLDEERWSLANGLARCRYLLTLALNDHDPQAAGGAVCELGLVPDPELFRVPVAGRATHNVRVVRDLVDSIKPERQRVLGLGLTDVAFRRDFAGFGASHGLSDPLVWTRLIVADRENWRFFFGNWPLREAITYDEVDIEVGDLGLPVAGEREQDAHDPVLRGITGQRYLPAGVGGLEKMFVPFEIHQDARQVPGLSKFRVQVMAEDADGDASSGHPSGGTPTEISTTVKAARTAKKSYRPLLRKLQQANWDEGWYYVRVIALDADGLPLAPRRRTNADRDRPSYESDRFYVIPDGEHDGPIDHRKRRAVGVTQASRDLEFAAVAESRSLESVRHQASRWQDPPKGADAAAAERTIVADFGSEGLVDIPLSPYLADLEARILLEPSSAGRWHLPLTVTAAAGSVGMAASEETSWTARVDVGLWSAFLDARAELFTLLTQPPGGASSKPGHIPLPVEACDLVTARQQVVRYADAYLALLNHQQSRLAGTTSPEHAAVVDALAELTRIDTVSVALTDHREVTHEVVLVAPTHPLRLLWLVAWAVVGRSWIAAVDAGDRATAAGAADALRSLEPLGHPLVVPRSAGRLAIAAFDLTPYWGVCLPDGTEDPQGLLALLQTALQVPDQSTLSDVWSGVTLADRLERYVRQHPYARTLVINAINIGRGDEVAEAIKLLHGRPGLDGLGYDLRLFVSDPEAPGTAESVASLLDADEPAPRILVSVRNRREFGLNVRDDAAHLTVLFDALSAEHVGTTVAEPQNHTDAPLPVYGLVQQMVTEYEDNRDTTVWRKRPRHGVAAELTNAEELSDLLSSLPAAISSAAATVATGQFVERQVPEISLALNADDSTLLDHAHRCSDWVITVDRTLGVEFFDNPLGSHRPDHVIDYAPESGTTLGHHMVVSSRSLDELRALLGPILQDNTLRLPEHHVHTFFEQLRLLSGRLAFKIASVAVSQRVEVLGLALARLYLEYQGALQNQILVPLDAHLELYRQPRHRAGAPSTGADLHRTDLALFDIDAASQTITCRLVEVKCFTSESGLGGYESLKNRIRTQVERSCEVIAEHFDPAVRSRPDRTVKNFEFANLLRFYLDRGRRHQVIGAEAATEAAWFIDRLGDGYRLNFTRTGLIFDLGGTGADTQVEGGIEFCRVGRDLVRQLLDAVPTKPTSQDSAREPLAESLRDAALTIPRLGSAAFQPTSRSHAAPVEQAERATKPDQADVQGVDGNRPRRPEGDLAPTESPPAGDDSTNVEKPHQRTNDDSLETAADAANARSTSDAEIVGADGPSAAVAPDVIVGTSAATPQYGLIGDAHGRFVALDLNETHTVSLFGVQGGGKSYTLGTIIESATMSVPPLNRLSSPLATIVFHYSATQDYAPEFTSMVEPNDDPAAGDSLRERFGVQPRGLSDVVLLAPRDQCEKRRGEYPNIDVRPLVFSSAELQATHWRFLMGAVGNQATYIRQLTRIMRDHRGDLRLATIRQAVEGSHLADRLKELALQRLDLAAEYIDDARRISDIVRPGRLIIVDLRDELIGKDEALGLFVVLMQLFADARSETGSFNKLVVFDEAHKYIDSPDLVKGLVESVREMRHKGMSVLVASQDPPSVPISLIELSDHIIVHKFTSPAWLKHLQKANAALSTVTADRLAELKPGEAYLWAGKSTDAAFTQRMMRIRTRSRLTRHGGSTRTATGE